MPDPDPRPEERAVAHAVEAPPDETPGAHPATAGGDGSREHGVGRDTDDSKVPVRILGGTAVVIAVLAVVYAATAYEAAGTVMLALSVPLVGWPAVYIWLQVKQPADPGPAEGESEPGDPEPFMPHASVWPFAIGAGAFFLANGLLLGPWFLFPGIGILVMAIGGFIAQSRARS